MIVDERLVTYINSLDTGNTPILDEIERRHLPPLFRLSERRCRAF